jgi:3-deoxy-manno-octulosonate cytidylyltransferase (CMP-KDO synthetase)
LIAGRPMIEHVYRRALEARQLDSVVVATDDERVASAVAAFGGTAVMTGTRSRDGHGPARRGCARTFLRNRRERAGRRAADRAIVIDAVVKLLLDRPEDGMSTVRRRIEDSADLANPSVVKS